MTVPQSRMSRQLLPILDSLKTKYHPLRIVETGSIRNPNVRYATGDGWSTFWIAKWVSQNGGSFTSIDLDTQPAYNFLLRRGLHKHVTLKRGSSLDILPTIDFAHLILLDSANDADLVLAEFKLVESKAKIIIIDDVIMDSQEVVKGHKVVPYAKEKYHVEIKDRLAIVTI